MKTCYRIRLKGLINLSAMGWFDVIAIFPQEMDETILVGQFPDQSALRGLIEHLWNLNITVLSIEQIDTPRETYTHNIPG